MRERGSQYPSYLVGSGRECGWLFKRLPEGQQHGEYLEAALRQWEFILEHVVDGRSGSEWFCGPDFVGMESIYDKIQYNPQLGALKSWDFCRWTPHVVVLAIGQNDANPENYMAENYNSEKSQNWRKHYKAFIEKLMTLYPKSYFVLTTTILGHDPGWDHVIDDVCREIGSSRVHHFYMRRTAAAHRGTSASRRRKRWRRS